MNGGGSHAKGKSLKPQLIFKEFKVKFLVEIILVEVIPFFGEPWFLESSIFSDWNTM